MRPAFFESVLCQADDLQDFLNHGMKRLVVCWYRR